MKKGSITYILLSFIILFLIDLTKNNCKNQKNSLD